MQIVGRPSYRMISGLLEVKESPLLVDQAGRSDLLSGSFHVLVKAPNCGLLLRNQYRLAGSSLRVQLARKGRQVVEFMLKLEGVRGLVFLFLFPNTDGWFRRFPLEKKGGRRAILMPIAAHSVRLGHLEVVSVGVVSVEVLSVKLLSVESNA